jgi:hypothetical protein
LILQRLVGFELQPYPACHELRGLHAKCQQITITVRKALPPSTREFTEKGEHPIKATLKTLKRLLEKLGLRGLEPACTVHLAYSRNAFTTSSAIAANGMVFLECTKVKAHNLYSIYRSSMSKAAANVEADVPTVALHVLNKTVNHKGK